MLQYKSYQPIIIVILTLALTACGSLEKKSLLISVGDPKDRVLSVMGTPDDRQLSGENEAWQYCRTGVGGAMHDYRIIWFHGGKVSGINSYKGFAMWSCVGGIKPVKWDDSPNTVIEIRNR